MIVITGCRGQLGTELSGLLADRSVGVDLPEVDITDFAALKKWFGTLDSVEAIVNCAAYTAVDRAEDEPEAAEKVNHLGPENLARLGVPMIHISTDYVFDGRGCSPYPESAATNPVSVYGRTKLAGEQSVLSLADTAVVIRTAWLYSPFGKNFVRTITRLGKERPQLRVVCDQVGTPTSARDLAGAIAAILPRLKPGMKGIYHYTNEGVCSWYDFALEILRLQNISCPVVPCSSEEYKTAAKRPFYSVLDKSKIKREFGLTIPHWGQSLAQSLLDEQWRR
ncbi:MAG: dTDP-4-dehydrorhamnose reductase [Thermoguttaceae bacterium]|nr:dTDP-4-dehydrorhamnose reductase [Thermoguttaceae bacterium]MBQ3333576.1 dTDP-4-dehydrorhamnose reductase [Thermoguttaceae bacterium]MBQ6620632.1 dTDP-4-dehydrorhamnose reductase [Thermoguttaceae bacterium]